MLAMECCDKHLGSGKWYSMMRDVVVLFYRSELYQNVLRSIRMEQDKNAIHIELLPNISNWVYAIAYKHVTKRISHTTNTRDILTELVLRFIKNEIPYKIVYCNEDMQYSLSGIYNIDALTDTSYIDIPIQYKTFAESIPVPVTLGQQIVLLDENVKHNDTYIRCIMEHSFYSSHMREYRFEDYGKTWGFKRDSITPT